MKNKKSFLFISCEEAKHICDKAQYGEATLWEKIKLKLRLLHCRLTRSYSQNNAQLSSMIKEAQVDCLKFQEKQALKENINKELPR